MGLHTDYIVLPGQYPAVLQHHDNASAELSNSLEQTGRHASRGRGNSNRPHGKEQHRSGQYVLRRYLLRSLLTLVGPLCLTSLYAFICVFYLQQPPVNDNVQATWLNARWLYYVWFVLAIISLDWGRIALPNIEAGTLMKPKLAPLTGTQLMWHTDANWANMLWWLRGLYAVASSLKAQLLTSRDDVLRHVSRPDSYWYFYSLTTAILLCALSLSGLSFELQDVSTYADMNAPIFGPNISTLMYRVDDELPRTINSAWQSGRQTTPHEGAIFYAPNHAENVPVTYFDDGAARGARSIEFFAGPSVHGPVHGEACGLWSNISCQPVARQSLTMIRWRNVNESYLYGCNMILDSLEERTENRRLQWLKINNSSAERAWPAWVNETVASGDLFSNDTFLASEVIAAADGSVGIMWPDSFEDNPFTGGMASWTSASYPLGVYNNRYGHDKWTFDSIVNSWPRTMPTTAIFEVFMTPPDYYNELSVHCDVATLTGYAKLDPIYRTFSDFRFAKAHDILKNYTGTLNGATLAMAEISPVQIIALGALAANQDQGKIARPLKPLVNTNFRTYDYPPMVVSIFNAINVAHSGIYPSGPAHDICPQLTAAAVQHAVYKLLGETVVALVADMNLFPWYGDLYTLCPTKYLVTGVVSWKIVLALLALWASMICFGAIWLLVFAGPRWAPTLNGFEMFKFGAQYGEEVSQFRTAEPGGCMDVLDHVLGMVGLLLGNGLGEDVRLGFIGLSECEITRQTIREMKAGRVKLTMDRVKAAKTRRYL